MTDRWQRVEELCQSALELEESRRAAFLEDACGGDAELQREVESLLRFEKRGCQFIEQPALEVAARMITPQKPESLLGQQVGSHQILSLLGAGGMGEVYRARDRKLNRDVALKFLPASVTHDSQRVVRFRREAQVLASINH